MNHSLLGQTISEIRFKEFRARYPRLHGKNAVKSYHGFGGSVQIAQIFTEEGVSGWGSLCKDLESARTAGKQLVGANVADVFQPDIGLTDDRFAAFDIALHDLAGKILQMPVARMMNPNAELQARVYDGAIYMNDIIPEERPQGSNQIYQDCQQDWALGHRTFKIKIGRGYKWMDHDEGLKRDIDIVREIHKRFPSAGIMVDANNGYSLEDAIAFLEGIDGVPLYWFEEPFKEAEDEDRALHEYINQRRPGTLIADGESLPDIPLLLDLAEKRVLDVIQPDVCGFGFTAWRKLMKTIADKGFRGSPHAWGDVVKTHYCAHLAAAYPHHIPCVEAVLGTSEGIDHSGYRLSEGVLSIPDKPGFGMDLIWAPEIEKVDVHMSR